MFTKKMGFIANNCLHIGVVVNLFLLQKIPFGTFVNYTFFRGNDNQQVYLFRCKFYPTFFIHHACYWGSFFVTPKHPMGQRVFVSFDVSPVGYLAHGFSVVV